MILRAKTKTLFTGKELTECQERNSRLNIQESEEGRSILTSYPRRIVLELTNACNLNCIMCGRNAADFRLVSFDMDAFYNLEPLFDIVEEVTLMGWGEPTIHPHFTEMLEVIDRHSARKYFCTNGMNLKKIKDAIFDYNVDVFAVSLDGATDQTNSRIRRGSDIKKITDDLKEIVAIKKARGLKYPWINFVFCAMKSNLQELPDLVRLAAEIGLDEVKVVYLTVFDNAMLGESLWNCQEEVEKAFSEAMEIADKSGIAMKLPHIQGKDEAGEALHKECFTPWRDFFLGSDGYVRPCMSTPTKFLKYEKEKSFMEIWNDKTYQHYRECVNNAVQMDAPCKTCYQSSYCNWNKKSSFLRTEGEFSPAWEKKG